MAGPQHVHTAGNAVSPLDDGLAELLDDGLAELLDDLAAVQDPGIDQIIAGLRYLALSRYTADRTQTLIATLAGGADGTNIVTAIGRTIARLADSDTNPALRSLPLDQQKNAALAGENAYRALADEDLHQTASETCAAIDGI